jgi:murein hydrolase activator
MIALTASNLRVLAFAGAFCGMESGLSWAQDASGQDLNTVQHQLDVSQSRQQEIAGEIETLQREADSISDRLVSIANNIQSRERAILASEQRLSSLAREEAGITDDLASKEDTLSQLLAGLQRLERNPPPALVVEPHDIVAALRGAILLGAVVPELRQEAENLADKLDRLKAVRTATELERQSIRDNIDRLTAAQAELNGLHERKSALLASAGQNLSDEKARADALAAKAKSLQQLTQSLAAESRRDAEEAALQKRRQEAALLKPRSPFDDNLGRLDYPSQGQILRKYGDEDGFGGKTKGVFVATRAGAQVVTPADAHVEFAGPFRSYGELLILDAGDGYHLLLAGLGEVRTGTGEFVRAGEPVGTMGDTAAPGTLIGDRLQQTGPVLYIEFRKNGEAIDSSPWWIGGLAQARG